jgi:hypothetical protein
MTRRTFFSALAGIAAAPLWAYKRRLAKVRTRWLMSRIDDYRGHVNSGPWPARLPGWKVERIHFDYDHLAHGMTVCSVTYSRAEPLPALPAAR